MSELHQRTRIADLHTLILAGGGQDWCCTDCLPEARSERGPALLDVAANGDPDAYCVYCGMEAAR